MKYAISCPHRGTYVGSALNYAFFSTDEIVDTYHASVFDTMEDAQGMVDELLNVMPGEFKITPVRSGYWKDLQEAGLHTGTMMENELSSTDPRGTA